VRFVIISRDRGTEAVRMVSDAAAMALRFVGGVKRDG
jgi:hypothetical protein